MSGNKIGGRKAAATNKTRHGDDFYKRIGARGGRNSTTGGFYANREMAREAGAKGGHKSRRDEAKRWWENNEAHIKELEESGLTTSEIAYELSVPTQRVYYCKRLYGGEHEA